MLLKAVICKVKFPWKFWLGFVKMATWHMVCLFENVFIENTIWLIHCLKLIICFDYIGCDVVSYWDSVFKSLKIEVKNHIFFKKKKIMANGSIEPVHIRKCCKSDYSPKYRWSWLSSCRSSDIIFLILKSHVVAQSAELCCRRQLKCVSQWTFRHDWVRIQHNQCSSCQDGWQGETKHSPADFGFCLGVISFPASSLSAAQL